MEDSTSRLLDNHLDKKRKWMPYELVPFDLGRDFNEFDPWDEQEYPLSEGLRSALYINLLTEDNLPYYSNSILQHSKEETPFRVWARQWTAEEARHSSVIRDWILVTRAIDPKLLEEGRMVQMSTGQVPKLETFSELLVYTSFQELATQVAHRNTAKFLDKEKGGKKVMAYVAGDEALHYEFYSGLAEDAIKMDSSTMLIAIHNQLKNFKMPGTGIPDFIDHAKRIEKEGIYSTLHFYNEVVLPTLNKWNFDSIQLTDPLAEETFLSIKRYLSRLGRFVAKQELKVSTNL